MSYTNPISCQFEVILYEYNEVFVITIPLVKGSLQLENTTKVEDIGKDHQSGRLVPF
jgi:hypothetical protein